MSGWQNGSAHQTLGGTDRHVDTIVAMPQQTAKIRHSLEGVLMTLRSRQPRPLLQPAFRRWTRPMKLSTQAKEASSARGIHGTHPAQDLLEWGPADTAAQQFDVVLDRKVPLGTLIARAPQVPALGTTNRSMSTSSSARILSTLDEGRLLDLERTR
jgi:hypothetical protein